jgi:predicted Rossmann-fold nucleotide-binding protein
MSRRTVEIHSLAEFDQHLAHTSALNGWCVQAVDLTERGDDLDRVIVRGAVFLGCRFGSGVEADLRRRGALIFPTLPSLPFDPYRPLPYTAEALYLPAGQAKLGTYTESPDAAIYAWSKEGLPVPALDHSLATALHDHAMADALDEALAHVDPRSVVGIMGGHALSRRDDVYWQAAELTSRLTAAGRLVLTGGGPGAMEAANLGAYLSPWPGALDEARSIMIKVPDFNPIDDWIETAFQVLDRWPAERAGRSVGIPTWFYGHEPSNVFATVITKYFANALREDTLLHRCRGGIVYLPGRAGTVQEIFQAVTENYYATDTTRIAPMILVGVDYWTRTLPAWPLLSALAADRTMAPVIACVDSVAEALDQLEAFATDAPLP